MRLRVYRCPSCHAQIQIDENLKKCFCNYCGAMISITDDNSFTYTYRKIDEARIREADADEKIRLKEIDAKAEDEKGKNKIAIFIFLILFIMFLVSFLMLEFDTYMEKKQKYEEDIAHQSMISVVSSYKDYVGENYDMVIQQFEDLGFTDIEAYGENDLSFDIFKKNNTVDKISINGDSKFDDNQWYDPDAKIRIYYHSYKDEKQQDESTDDDSATE